MALPVIALQWLLRKSATRETSKTPELWTPENPLYGHCAVATVIAEDFLGGTTKRGVFPEEWRDKLGYPSHYWNVLPDGTAVDLSKSQFPQDFPHDAFMQEEVGEEFSLDVRSRILANEDTRQRYELLLERMKKLLGANRIFNDDNFQHLWGLAFSEKAKCAKMRFACAVYEEGRLIARDVNRLMTEQFGKERFCSLDGSRCIRMNLPHRADPAFGDCGHAPIWCLQQVFEQRGFRPSELERLHFFEAGFYLDGAPWLRARPEYTCATCEHTFAIFGLKHIWVPLSRGWVSCETRKSFYSAADYMSGTKKV